MPSSEKKIRELEESILDLLDERDPGKTICPSEAARRTFPDSWRDEMDNTRAAAQNLTDENKIEICQKGEVVNPENLRGPIRLRKKLNP